MDDFVNLYQYHLAWLIYFLSGSVFSLAWWRLTSGVKNAGWRDLVRGMALVFIFTPWYVSEAQEHAAPAIVVAVMDLFLGSTDNGLSSAICLLSVTAIMLVWLLGKRLFVRNHDD